MLNLNLSKVKNLRKIFIPLLKKINIGNISIKHHYTGDKFVLDAYTHKGYWYHGKNRELDTILALKKIIQPGDTIIEVGGHIGYLTVLFSQLTSKNGVVYVFEPGNNNLPYLKRNIQNLANVSLLEMAVSDREGFADFYIENLSGQNNSLLADYGEENYKMAFTDVKVQVVKVETIRLDTFCKSRVITPQFIKIDIEGAELLALKGMQSILKNSTPIMMIEITKNYTIIFELLQDQGYRLYTDTGQLLTDKDIYQGNAFCFHFLKHQHLFNQIFN